MSSAYFPYHSNVIKLIGPSSGGAAIIEWFRELQWESGTGASAPLRSIINNCNKAQTLKPVVPQPGLLPEVTSLKAPESLEYKRGFKNPKEGFPFESRASFNIDIIPANAGAAADVPLPCPAMPW